MGNLVSTLVNASNALGVYGKVFDTIQNNITNANTPGYVEQDQALVSQSFDPEAGESGGVAAAGLISSRSEYLEQQVRNQQQLLGASQQQATDLNQVQTLFDPTATDGISGNLSSFFNSFSQLSVNPNDPVERQAVINAAGQVAESFNTTANGIAQVSTNIDNETNGNVATINQIAEQLAAFNQQYLNSSQASQDAGLDAQVHSALENLSQVANFTALKMPNGTWNVYLGGQTPLVLSNQQFTVSADMSAPNTVIRDSQGNDITSQITSGSLGALLGEKNTTLPGYMSSLNTLAQTFADSVNNALNQGIDQNGNAPTQDLFTYNAAQGAAFSMAVTPITPDQIAAALPSGPGGNGNAIAIAQLATQPVVNGFTFTQAYGNLSGQIGSDVSNAQQEQTADQNLLTQAQTQRTNQTGVSLDAEAAKLLQFQQSYQAVGKLVGVINSLTDTLMAMMPATS